MKDNRSDKSMNIKKKKRWIILIICAVLFFALTAWTVWGNTALELNSYIISDSDLPKAFDGFRIAQISDLHNAEIGTDNTKLIEMLRDSKPDIIAITGDLIDSRNTNIEIALKFADNAMDIAPCYYVTGNHEARIAEYLELKKGLKELGVIVIEDEKLELKRSGETVILLGVDDPSFQTDQSIGDSAVIMQNKLQKLLNQESGYSILLSHHPELFDVYKSCDINLVLSGHAHGGQIRLPFVGGVVAPGQGLFPKYDSGLYAAGKTNMIVSRGIGNSIIPLRFNNRPEIILIELRKQ